MTKRVLSSLAFLSLCNFAVSQPFFQRVTHQTSCTQLYSRGFSFFPDGSSVGLLSINDPTHGVNGGAAFSYVNSTGNTLWMRGSDSLGSHGAVKLAGGDLIVLGYSRYLGTSGLTAGDGNFVLTRFAANGTVVWTKAFGNQFDDFGNYMHLLPSGNIEVYGLSENYAAGTFDNFRARISPAGVLLEMKFQFSTNTTFTDYYDYEPATGNTYAMCSGTAGSFYVKCLDSTFNILWENHYTTNFSSVYAINAADDGTILIAGRSAPTASATDNTFILNISSTGTTLWSRRYDFGGDCRFTSVDMTPSGSLIATGYSTGYSDFTVNGDYENRIITCHLTHTGTPVSSTVYGSNVRATGYQAFAKNDSVFYFGAEHGLLRLTDSYMILRVDSTLTNPTFCYEYATVNVIPLTFTSTPYASSYTLQLDTVQVINDNANYQSIPITNILICPTAAHTYQTDGEAGRVVTATSDSGFVFITNEGAMKMTKYDPEGNILWSYILNINSPYYPGNGYDIIEASNGDIVIGHGGGHACLTRTDRDGNPLWCTDKSVGGNEVSLIGSVVETPDHDFVTIAGLQQGNFPTTARFAIIKYDSLGNSIWTKEYLNAQSSSGGLDADGNGISASGNGIYNAFVIQTDTAGNVIWSREINNAGPTAEVTLNFAERCPNGDVLFAGYIWSTSPAYHRPYLVRFDSSGNVVWQKMFQPGSESVCGTVSLIQLSGDNYVVSAMAPGGSTANFKSFTFKIDAAGNVLWSRCAMPTTGGGIEYGQGAVGYDSCLAFPATEYAVTTNFRFDKYSSSGQGPCGTVAATVVGSVPTTTTITDPGLTAFNVALTETALAVTLVLDSAGREFVCAEGDTAFYYHVFIDENTEQSNTSINLQEHKIFPVPTSGNLNIDGFTSGQECAISVYSVTGQLFSQVNVKANDSGVCAITMDNSIPGVYIIKVTDTEEHQLATGMIIIQ